jgi:hypothetical protein
VVTIAAQAALAALKEGTIGGDSEGALKGLLAHSLRAELASMFLDVATILRGQPQDRVLAVWEAWHGPAALARFADLRRRCLLGVDEEGRLVMHDVLVLLGRGIILQSRPGLEEHFGSRLWMEGREVVGKMQVHCGYTGCCCLFVFYNQQWRVLQYVTAQLEAAWPLHTG